MIESQQLKISSASNDATKNSNCLLIVALIVVVRCSVSIWIKSHGCSCSWT